MEVAPAVALLVVVVALLVVVGEALQH